uniref:Uncharacterized protein n=1 Tax=mine drainage metagenome TaxID=410659 RepID=E6QJK5_9ZZZZ
MFIVFLPQPVTMAAVSQAGK